MKMFANSVGIEMTRDNANDVYRRLLQVAQRIADEKKYPINSPKALLDFAVRVSEYDGGSHTL